MNAWEEMHGRQEDPIADEVYRTARALLDEDYPGLREHFGDLVEIRLTRYGASVERGDTGALIAEYDIEL